MNLVFFLKTIFFLSERGEFKKIEAAKSALEMDEIDEDRKRRSYEKEISYKNEH